MNPIIKKAAFCRAVSKISNLIADSTISKIAFYVVKVETEEEVK